MKSMSCFQKKANLCAICFAYILLMIDFCFTQSARGTVLLWTVRYDNGHRAIKQIYGDPETWVADLKSGRGFKPRELTDRRSREFATLGVHHSEGLVFWSDRRSTKIEFGQVLFDSSGSIRTVTSSVNGQVGAIAIDWINNVIYWAENQETNGNQTSIIYKAKFRDPIKTKEIVIDQNLENVQGLEIVPQLGYLWFSDTSRRVIERSDLSGENRTTFVSFPDREAPVAIVFDFNAMRLYWLSHGATYGQISSADVSGNDVTQLIKQTSLLGRTRMTAYKDFLFLTYKEKNSFDVFHKLTGVLEIDAHLGNPGKVHDIKIFAADSQPLEIVTSSLPETTPLPEGPDPPGDTSDGHKERSPLAFMAQVLIAVAVVLGA